jgi:antitoxin (DNA-binding transcriptional repressor) of toxin-antitoxin stability system
MQVVSLSEAKNKLSSLVSRVAEGDEIGIARHGQVLVRLVREPRGDDKKIRAAKLDAARAWAQQLSEGVFLGDDGTPLSVEALKMLAREGRE